MKIIQNNISYHYVCIIPLYTSQQSSLYFQALSAFSNVSQNIFFNGPRAGVVFNDGFIGGNSLEWNLMLNTCRESGDHGV